jgi:thiol-disulfide isomerase/thioredoxin
MGVVFASGPPGMMIRTPRRRAALAVGLTGLLAALPVGSALAASDALLRPWPAKQATPPLKLAGLDGQAWDLSSLRGKVVVVNFWASWCGPCVAELPVLGALAQDPALRDKVVVVGVNYKEPLDAIHAFTAARPIPYPVVRDRSGEMFKAWTQGVMPTTILVDRQGRARWRSVGEIGAGDQRLRRSIEAMLAE